MSSIAGWYGSCDCGEETLEAMIRPLGLEGAVIERHREPGFALASTQPALARATQRIARDDEADLTVGFAGYLYSTDAEARHHPARHCLRLYQQHGLRFPEQLNGTFAVIVKDGAAGRLHLVADRLATRELYYAEHTPLLFAGEIKGLLSFPGFTARILPEEVWQLLATEQITGFGSLYDRIRQVPPATVLSWDGSRWEETRYWQPRFTWSEHATTDECGERMAEALVEAMGRVCPDEHERCVLLLSGGCDSRAVALGSPRPLDCLTMHEFEDAREVQVARSVARVLGFPHHYVRLPGTFPLEVMEPGTVIGDGVASFRHAHPLYLIDRITELGSALILNGGWLGVFFGGQHQPHAPRSGLGRLAPQQMRRISEDFTVLDYKLGRYQSAPSEVLEDLLTCDLGDVLSLLRSRVEEMAERMAPGALAPNDLIELIDAGNTCKQRSNPFIRFVERVSASGEAAWDRAVLDAFLATPPWLRYNQRAYRRALVRMDLDASRIINANDGVPVTAGPWRRHLEGSLRARARQCMAGVAGRLWPNRRLRHIGALPSTSKITARHEAWRSLLRSRAGQSRLAELGLIRRGALERLVEDHISERTSCAKLLCMWLTLENWLDHCDEMGWGIRLAEPSHQASGARTANRPVGGG